MRWTLLFAVLAGGVGAAAEATDPDEIVWGCDRMAGYFGPTTEYRHGVLGDELEYKGLIIAGAGAAVGQDQRYVLPEGRVFEDIAPRCGDLTGDGLADVVTVIADAKVGARLAVFSPTYGPVAQTAPIGQGFRWLAPFAIGDLDGDGQNDVAYVDRPHLAGVLRIVTLRGEELAQIASMEGFSNHRIGEDFITGGMRDCGDGPELVLPNFNWSALMMVRWNGEGLAARQIASATDPGTIAATLACDD